MRRLRPLAQLLLGFGLATLAGMVLRASPVMAQQSWSDLSISRPPAAAPPAPLKRPAAAPQLQDPLLSIAPTPVVAGLADTVAMPVVPLRPSVPIERDQTDGETERPVGADLAVDGHMEVVEPKENGDDRELFPGDPRLPEDRAAFLAPAAGYDALAFQIELDPASDPRAARLATLDPYAPVAHRAGGWVFFPTLEAGIGSTTNVYRTTSARPDLIFDVRPTLVAVTDWQQHALQFKATGLASDYRQFPSENERSYAFEARARLDISRRSNIEVLASHSLDQEPRSSLSSPADAKQPTPFTTDKIAMAFNQRFNRLSLQVRGAVTEYGYSPVGTYDGGVLSNAERDFAAKELALRAAWNFTPALAAFAETAHNSQLYRIAPADGISRDSTGDRFKLGLSFGTLSQIWRGEIAAGYGRQSARDGRLKNAEGVIIDANVGWKPSSITSVLFKAQTDFITSTEPGQGNATAYTASVELRHALRHDFIAIAGVSYQVTGYQAPADLVERTTTAELGWEYYLTRTTTLSGKYSHVLLASTAPDASTTTDSVRLGVRYRP